MKKIGIALVAGMAAAVSACATDEFAESRAKLTPEQLGKEVVLKPLAAGSAFTFSANGGTTKITVKKMDGFSVHQEQQGPDGTATSEAVGFGATLSSREHMSEAERARVAQLFPLKIGKRATSGHGGTTASGIVFTTTDKLEVVTMETVKVPAGTFETFVIRTDMSNANWWGQNTCWYAPEIGYCAKRKFRSATSSLDWELASVTKP